MNSILKNHRYEILSINGFTEFHGIRESKHTKYFDIFLKSGKNIKCSFNHPFLQNGNIKKACDIVEGDYLDTENENDYVDKIILQFSDINLYDLIEVGNANIFIINDNIISHNCSFLTSGNTVIDAEILQFCTTKLEEPIEKRGIGGDLWIWKYPEITKSYLLASDPSRGDGEDYSGLVVMEVESNEQVAEFKGKIDTQTFGRMCVSLGMEYNNALLIIDNKNVGWSTVQVALDAHYPNLYYSYKNDPFLDENIHLRKMHDLKQKEDMVPGLTTTTRIRPVLISKLEMYFRDFGVLVRSKRLLNELKVFMWLGGKAQAQRGYNDDLVMALGMALYIRDTSLKLHQMGVDLNRFALKNTYKSVYKPLPAGSSQWEMQIGPNGQKENLKWLLK